MNVERSVVGPRLPFAILAREFVLKLTGATLHILATWSVLRTLAPVAAGVYFEGFVLAYGLAALARNKYEIYLARYVLADHAAEFGIPVRTLLAAFARRTLLRCAIICAVFLVLTADLDIQEPRLLPYLETFLPFVLALPFATLAMLFAGALRAANRSVGSIVISAYSVNIAISVAAVFAPENYSLLVLCWAFFAGSVAAAVIGMWVIRRAFPIAPGSRAVGPEPWARIYAGVYVNGYTGIALAVLAWGPLCVLAVVGPVLQFAQFAAVARTALVLEIMLPAALFVPGGSLFQPGRVSRSFGRWRPLAANTAVAALAASVWLIALWTVAPSLFAAYGEAYVGLVSLLLVVLGTHWVNGVGRPAIRVLIETWPPRSIRNALAISALAATLISILGVPYWGSYAIAFGSLAGALLINGQSVFASFRPREP